MSKYLSITEDWVKEKVKISSENLEDIKTLILQGNYEEKITCLGASLLHFSRLKILDLSRNVLKSIKGIEHIKTLEVLNLYYNCIEDINELRILSFNQNIRDLDLRLNPISRMNSDYRLYLTYILPKLKTLDCRMLRDTERKAAMSFFGTDSTVDICPSSMLRKLDDMRSSKVSKTRRDHSPHFIEKADRLLKYYQDNNTSLINPEIWSNDGHNTINNPSFYDAEAYDPTNRSLDSWTNNILHANSKFRLLPPSLDPPRGIKHAEFYNCKERLQTELEFTVPGRKNHADEKESITDVNGFQPHKECTERCLSTVPSDMKIGNGPCIPPRCKRFTPSSLLSNGSIKKTSVEHDKTHCLTEINKHSESSLIRNDYGDNNSIEKIDHAFFLIMKNFIEEAVSESFARYKLNELKNNVSKYSSPAIITTTTASNCSISSGCSTFSTLPPTTFSANRIHASLNKAKSSTHIDMISNGYTNNSNHINENKNHVCDDELFSGNHILSLEHPRKPQEKRVEINEFVQERNEIEYSRKDYREPTTRNCSTLNQDENMRNKELECENSRLTAEVERLKTRLRLYEELASAMNSNMAAFHPVIPLSLNNPQESTGINNDYNQTSGSTTMKRAMSLISSNSNLLSNPTTSAVSLIVPSEIRSENDLTRQEQFPYNNV
ncbi:Centrosomal protein of 72 kDa [Schistosoma japonicum]|uniref:Centrosomal protein of 72 kDa n=1 Tax=Schistosoma japonicum TaxID=6182 RepID=A0A4Z2CSM0_SCHJA|nr:Centrosomal protein of 72 kDa [Schistosoma japonicum]